MTTTTYQAPRFNVEPVPGTDTWMITEDGHFDCAVSWNSKSHALDALERASSAADRVVSAGYSTSPDPDCIYIDLEGERVELLLPTSCTPSIRTHIIRANATQYFIDRESGDN